MGYSKMKTGNILLYGVVSSIILTTTFAVSHYLVPKEDCGYEVNDVVKERHFNSCMDKVAAIRATEGGSYATGMAERLDKVIAKCDDIAWRYAAEYKCSPRK